MSGTPLVTWTTLNHSSRLLESLVFTLIHSQRLLNFKKRQSMNLSCLEPGRKQHHHLLM